MSAPYNLTATITTQQGCTWTANPDASWITLDGGQSGSGSGTISFRVSDNWDAPREGVVMVRWPTPTAGQNVRVLQAGCLYAVSTTAVSVGAAGGPGRFDVIQQSVPITAAVHCRAPAAGARNRTCRGSPSRQRCRRRATTLCRSRSLRTTARQLAAARSHTRQGGASHSEWTLTGGIRFRRVQPRTRYHQNSDRERLLPLAQEIRPDVVAEAGWIVAQGQNGENPGEPNRGI